MPLFAPNCELKSHFIIFGMSDAKNQVTLCGSWNNMKENAQILPVTTWELEPKLGGAERNGRTLATAGMLHRPAIRRRVRRELEVLGWEARLVRLGR